MTFPEFVAEHDTPEDRPEDYPHWEMHWRAVLPQILHGVHDGDCVGQPQTCTLCWLEEMLTLYRKETVDAALAEQFGKHT